MNLNSSSNSRRVVTSSSRSVVQYYTSCPKSAPPAWSCSLNEGRFLVSDSVGGDLVALARACGVGVKLEWALHGHEDASVDAAVLRVSMLTSLCP